MASGLGFGLRSPGLRFGGLGFRVQLQGLEFRMQGFRFGVRLRISFRYWMEQ